MSNFAFRYEHTDIPAGTTLREYRAAKRPSPRPRGLRQVIQLMRWRAPQRARAGAAAAA
jgi:hypothetical protein